jgi:tRNA uridine 5-carboxymethylaminomethyl modification enzyme
MFTSRAEFRLHLRIDNADRRLTPHGRRLGLIDDAAWAAYEEKQLRAAAFERSLEGARVRLEELPEELRERLDGDGATVSGTTFPQFLKRPEVVVEELAPLLLERLRDGGEVFAGWVAAMDGAASGLKESGRAAHDAHLSDDETVAKMGHPASAKGLLLPAWVRNEMKSVETEIKYSGYLDQQRRSMEKMRKAERRGIPEWFDYKAVSGLSREMQETLERVRPQTLGQASRIAGVTPAAVSLLHVFIEIQGRARVA